MFGWFRRKEPRVEELLEQLIDRVDYAGRYVKELDRKLDGLIETPGQLQEAVELMRREPFAALKSWIEQSTVSRDELQKQRREFIERERQLLERWRAHTAALEARILKTAT